MITKTSPEWPGTKAWLEEQIEKRRLLLEAKGRSNDDSNTDRGFIEAYRSMIATIEPKEGAPAPGRPARY